MQYTLQQPCPQDSLHPSAILLVPCQQRSRPQLPSIALVPPGQPHARTTPQGVTDLNSYE
jgi:hypothetical protein